MKNKNSAVEDKARKIFETLPDEIDGFTLEKIFAETEDKFFYFTFDNKKIHRSVTAYFHEETFEFKLRAKIGLNEFCLTEFFTSDFEIFAKKINADISSVIKKLSDSKDTNPLVKKQNLSAWKYGQNLPKNLEGFELFISPENPVAFTNGSHIIINYSDFENHSDLTIYYNIYANNFSAESRKKDVSNVVYSLDSENLQELESNLEKNLAAELSALVVS